MAHRVVQLEIHGDLAVRFFTYFERVVTRRGLSVDSEDTLARARGRLAHGAKDPAGNPQARQSASVVKYHLPSLLTSALILA